MRKSIDDEFSRPLSILSAFQPDSLPGIYVEARSAKQVQQACAGLVGVYPSRGTQLVPIEEMASLLQIKKQDTTLTPGTWVQIRDRDIGTQRSTQGIHRYYQRYKRTYYSCGTTNREQIEYEWKGKALQMMVSLFCPAPEFM